MIRTQVQFEPRELERVRAYASRHGQSIAAVVREAVARYVTTAPDRPRVGLGEARPAFRARPLDDLSEQDRAYTEAIERSKPRSL